jgi:hypothetical protein
MDQRCDLSGRSLLCKLEALSSKLNPTKKENYSIFWYLNILCHKHLNSFVYVLVWNETINSLKIYSYIILNFVVKSCLIFN